MAPAEDGPQTGLLDRKQVNALHHDLFEMEPSPFDGEKAVSVRF